MTPTNLDKIHCNGDIYIAHTNQTFFQLGPIYSLPALSNLLLLIRAKPATRRDLAYTIKSGKTSPLSLSIKLSPLRLDCGTLSQIRP